MVLADVEVRQEYFPKKANADISGNHLDFSFFTQHFQKTSFCDGEDRRKCYHLKSLKRENLKSNFLNVEYLLKITN
jgi:hypothetical protein